MELECLLCPSLSIKEIGKVFDVDYNVVSRTVMRFLNRTRKIRKILIPILGILKK
jgi:transposase-like protein